MQRYHCATLQDQGLASWDETVSDYHPLFVPEIQELLDCAAKLAAQCTEEDIRVLGSIQTRLCQGIVGYQSPNVSEGPVCEAQIAISRRFVSACRDGFPADLSAFALELFCIMFPDWESLQPGDPWRPTFSLGERVRLGSDLVGVVVGSSIWYQDGAWCTSCTVAFPEYGRHEIEEKLLTLCEPRKRGGISFHAE